VGGGASLCPSLTRLGASGCDAWTLLRIAGHSSINMSMRYVHPAEDAIQKAFAALTGETIPEGGHKTGHNRELRVRQIAGNPHEYRVEMVSAAGLEPATHALKGSPN